MYEDITIRQALNSPIEKIVGNGSTNCGLWYDWFCSNKSLINRGETLVGKLKQIVNSPKINIDTMYVFFKNNCPMIGSTYDDFRICDVKTGNVIFTIIPKNNEGKCEVWGQQNEFEKELFVGSWADAKKWFNS